jgi:hypothetical protein
LIVNREISMRRLLATSVVLLAAVVASAGCSSTSGANEPAWHSPGSTQAAPDDGPGSATVVCGSIRTVVTSDMGPLGSAFGAMVGKATAKDDDDQEKAEDQAATALKKLGSDISAASAVATDTTLRAAGKTVEANIVALAADPSYLSGITTMDAIAAATTKLQQATGPVTAACAGS